MQARFWGLLLVPVLALSAASKKVATATGDNDDLTLTVTLHLDPEDIKELVGSTLDGHYYVAEVKVAPKYGKEIQIERDAFLLRSNNDNDTSRPFAASRVAGQSSIVVTRVKGGVGTAGSQPTYDGMPVPPIGMRYPSNGQAVGGGGAQGDFDSAKATVKNAGDTTVTPLEKTLEAKILPEKKTDQPVSGLLYFAMEKQKMKDLELVFGGKENRIRLRFK